MTNDELEPQMAGAALSTDDDLAPIGRRRFLAGAGSVAGAGALSSVLPAGVAEAALPDGATSFTPLPAAVRVADTRDPSGTVFTAISDRHIRVEVSGRHGVPVTATAVVLTVTAVNFGEANYVTVYPRGTERPLVSNLNMTRPGATTANLVTVKIGTHNSIDVFSKVACDTIVDLLGYYAPVDGPVREGRFVGLPTPTRAIDTRNSFGYASSGSYTWVDLTADIPTDASSVVINLTATECTGPGYFSALPAGADESRKPTTSSLNVTGAGDTRAASVIVPVPTVAGRRRIKIYTRTAAKLIVDVNGYFTGPLSSLSTVGLFVPQSPVRILDTRQPGDGPKLWPGWVVECKVPDVAAANAAAIVVNVTGVESRGPGYLTVSAARRNRPHTSNVNWMTPAAIVPNHVITRVTATYGCQVFSSHGAHVVVDMAGYFTGTPQTPKLPPHVDPPPPPAPPDWVLNVPRLGLRSTVKAGDPSYVTNQGYSWHWAGTGYVGQEANIGLFAHRTSHGGVYRYLHALVVGDTWTITTGDNRVYTYRIVGRTMVRGYSRYGPSADQILAANRAFPGTTMSLIACTLTNWLPTSLNHRIVVTGELIGWYEL